jgi:hypothetical protein
MTWRVLPALLGFGLLTTGCRCANGLTVGGDAGAPDAGACQPDAGILNCGGRCLNTTGDPANCGGCGKSCDGGLCCSSACVDGAGCGFAVTAVKPNTGWQNGGGYVTLIGAGFADGMKAYIADGRAPIRVLDSAHALIQTPPGPVGAQPVRIVLGTQTAVTQDAFTYQSSGIANQWAQKPLQKVRGEDPGVAVMQDGRVLVAGGTTVPDSLADTLNTAEIYDPVLDQVTPAANAMSTNRWQNSAVTLLTGKVLVTGGACNNALGGCVGDPTRADLFDPSTNTFTPTAAPLTLGRAYVRAVLMVDGRVFIASANDPSVEIYDPAHDGFTQLANAPLHPFGFVVRLRDGRVLVGGGDGTVTAVEAFDPDTNTFAAVGPLTHGRAMLTAHTLPDSRVLVIGGTDVSAGGINAPLNTMETFDPVANTFTQLGYTLVTPRAWLASALVRSGKVLVMGGYTVTGQCSSFTDSVELVDPVAGNVTAFPTLLNKNCEWNAVTLLDGSVLGVGGGACGTASALPDLDFLPAAAQ